MSWQQVKPDDLMEPPVDMVLSLSLSLFAFSHLFLSTWGVYISIALLSYGFLNIPPLFSFLPLSPTVLRTLCIQNDMLRALQVSKPTVNDHDLEQLEKFTKEFGMES